MLSSRARRLLAGAILVAAFLALYAFSNLTAIGQAAENSWARAYQPEQTVGWWLDEAHLPPFGFDRLTIAAGALLAVGIAAARRRWRDLVIVAIATPVAIGATGVFKEFAARPRLVPSLDFDVSYPSGHAAIPFAVTAALLLVVPRRHLRWWVPVLTGWSALVASGLQAEGQHRASEVLGSGLLVAAVFLVASAVAARTASPRLPMPGRGLLAVPAAAALVGAVAPVLWMVAVYATASLASTALVAATALACRTADRVPAARLQRSDRAMAGRPS